MDSDFIRRVGACLAKLNVSFPHIACSAPATLVWAEAFDGLAIEDVEAAVREHIKYDTKQPTPAHIRKRAIDIRNVRRKQAKQVRIGAITWDNPPNFELEAEQRRQAAVYTERKAAKDAAAKKTAEPPKWTAEDLARQAAYKQHSIDMLKRRMEENNSGQ